MLLSLTASSFVMVFALGSMNMIDEIVGGCAAAVNVTAEADTEAAKL